MLVVTVEQALTKERNISDSNQPDSLQSKSGALSANPGGQR